MTRLLAILALTLTGCASPGVYRWNPSGSGDSYTAYAINPGTLLSLSHAAHSMSVAVNGTGSLPLTYRIPKKITGPADIEIRKTYSSDNSVVVNAGFDLFYE